MLLCKMLINIRMYVFIIALQMKNICYVFIVIIMQVEQAMITYILDVLTIFGIPLLACMNITSSGSWGIEIGLSFSTVRCNLS